jgi:3-oxoacyl-[acyl-carrier-protein] synthase-1
MTVGRIATIEGVGALCSVGRGIRQVQASIRAGLGRSIQSPVHDRRGEPVTMSLVPAEALSPLAAPLLEVGLTSRQRRMIQLTRAPLLEATAARETAAPMPLFLGLPEARPGERVSPGRILSAVGLQAGIGLDEAASAVFQRGRAAGLLALGAGLRCLAEGRHRHVLVGGVDTFFDLALLAELDGEQRIAGQHNMDGFVPGEGAAFLLLRSDRGRRSDGQVGITGVGAAQDPGHRYSDKPAKGEGLAQAMDGMFKATGQAPPIAAVFAGFNGESFWAKEWGVARLRHGERFAPASSMQHPADCHGDTGAAAGPLLLAVAHAAVARGGVEGAALVFASSDRGDSACAMLQAMA